MLQGRIQLYSDHCTLLPAFFLGCMDTSFTAPVDEEKLPAFVVPISQDHGSTAIRCAHGTGLLIPLTMTPLNGPLVDVLRMFGEFSLTYFDISRAGTHEQLLERMLDHFAEKYPRWQGLRAEIAHVYSSIVPAAYEVDAETCASLSRLLAHFVDVPPVADGTTSALVKFSGSVEKLVMGWPCVNRELFPCCSIVNADVIDEARDCLPKFESYLLWENAD